MTEKDNVTFEGEAKRSQERPRYDLIPRVILDAMAARFTLGAKKFGEHNWKSGGPEFFRDAQNHLVNHLWDYIERNENEEPIIGNLEAVMWNAGALLWWETEGKKNWQENLKKSNAPRLRT